MARISYTGRVKKIHTKEEWEEEKRYRKKYSKRLGIVIIILILAIIFLFNCMDYSMEQEYQKAAKGLGPSVTLDPGGGIVSPREVIYIDISSNSQFGEVVTSKWDSEKETALNIYVDRVRDGRPGHYTYYYKNYYKLNAPQEPGLHTLRLVVSDPSKTIKVCKYTVVEAK